MNTTPTNINIHSQIAEKIIEGQEEIIGPLAVEQARKVPGLSVNWEKHEVTIQGDQKQVIDQLIRRYGRIFGPASIEVCKNAAKQIAPQVPSAQLPEALY